MVVAKGGDGEVNIEGGDGDNTFVVEGANVSLGTGRNVIYGTGTFNNYDPDTGSEFRLPDVSNIYDAFMDGGLSFKNGALDTGSGDITLNENAGNVGSITINLTDANGNTVRAQGTGAGGGTMDGSGSSQPVLYVGNTDGSKTGTTNITTGSGNDSAIAGASDVVANSGGTDEITLANSESGGATLDQTANPPQRATNNISGYNPLLNMIRQTAEMLGQMTARFVNGRLQTRFGNMTNNFFGAGSFRDLADLGSADADFVEKETTVKVETTDASTTVRLDDEDMIVLDANGYNGDAVLIGNNNDNVIYGGSGNNSLWGGESGDDTLFGGDGSNEFYYMKGNGDDVIENAKDGDVIKLLDISMDDINVRFTEVDDDKVVVSMQDGGSLTLNGNADVTFELNDGTKLAADRKNKGFSRK